MVSIPTAPPPNSLLDSCSSRGECSVSTSGRRHPCQSHPSGGISPVLLNGSGVSPFLPPGLLLNYLLWWVSNSLSSVKYISHLGIAENPVQSASLQVLSSAFGSSPPLRAVSSLLSDQAAAVLRDASMPAAGTPSRRKKVCHSPSFTVVMAFCLSAYNFHPHVFSLHQCGLIVCPNVVSERSRGNSVLGSSGNSR